MTENVEILCMQLCAPVRNIKSFVVDKTAVCESNLSAVDGSGVYEPIMGVGFFLLAATLPTVKSE